MSSSELPEYRCRILCDQDHDEIVVAVIGWYEAHTLGDGSNAPAGAGVLFGRGGTTPSWSHAIDEWTGGTKPRFVCDGLRRNGQRCAIDVPVTWRRLDEMTERLRDAGVSRISLQALAATMSKQ